MLCREAPQASWTERCVDDRWILCVDDRWILCSFIHENATGTYRTKLYCTVCVVCLLKEQRHWPLQNQARGSRLGSLL
jgi:hypothetical protein